MALDFGANPAEGIPAYIEETYHWAYVDRRNAWFLDREPVVTSILFGQSGRLRAKVMAHIEPGQSVLQVAHVYGRLLPDMARRIGPGGQLDVIDIVPLQAEHARAKLDGMAQARVRIADAAEPGDGTYDIVNCYFLLHEVPDDKKRAIVAALLKHVRPGGKVVFIDYHRPALFNPLRAYYVPLFHWLEPFARSLWTNEIRDLAGNPAGFAWEKQTYFGGVFQHVVARRDPAGSGPTGG